MNGLRFRIGLILLGAILLIPLAADQASAETINWLTMEEAQQKAQRQGQKIFYFFYTDWCTYCKKMDRITFTNADVAAYINRYFIPVRINSDKNKSAAAQFGIQGVPDLRFLTPEGEAIARLPGYIEADKFLPLLKYIQTDSYLKMGFKEFLDQSS